MGKFHGYYNKLRICLDPRNLNKIIKHLPYPLTSFENVNLD